MLRLPGVRASFPSGALAPTDADRAEMAASRVRRRIYDIMAAAAAAPQPECAWTLKQAQISVLLLVDCRNDDDVMAKQRSTNILCNIFGLR